MTDETDTGLWLHEMRLDIIAARQRRAEIMAEIATQQAKAEQSLNEVAVLLGKSRRLLNEIAEARQFLHQFAEAEARRRGAASEAERHGRDRVVRSRNDRQRLGFNVLQDRMRRS